MTTATELFKRRIADGILAFPATPFDARDAIDETVYAGHIRDLVNARPTAIAPAGGAGEIFSLSPEEHRRLIEIAVAEAGNVPVIAGAGLGVGVAVAMATAAERAGAHGILLFPPYLITGEQDGLAAYIERVCAAVSIGVIAYSRNNGVIAPDTALRLADSCPNLVAIKDGTGDFEMLVAIRQRAGDRLGLINGVPTAEIIARQCFALGVRSYTSAVFTFLPAVATRYYRALREGDDAMLDRLLHDFYVPLTALRNRRRGYAVAIVKAGLRAVGRPAGPVRPPLVDLTAAEEAHLEELIARATSLVEDDAARPGDARAVG